MTLSERQIRWTLIAIGVGAYILLMTLEVITDEDATNFADLMVDAITLLLTITASAGVALLAQRMQSQHEEKMHLIRDLEMARDEGETWRAKVQSQLAGIKAEMDRQFEEWELTSAEREVGLLILKGLNHREIALARNTTEATTRQQAQSIYQKASLPSKTAFSAYFLEDLLLPEAMNIEATTPNSTRQ